MFRAVLVFLVVAGLAACSSFRFPGVHRITVQQGNVITQQMIDRLKPGMTRSQVRFVLGNAIIDDSLDVDRWDYIYTVQIPDGETIRRMLTLYFVDEKLSWFTGDFVPSEEYKAILNAGGQAPP